MLENLYIKDFILIDELNIDFKEGFSAFTGETGAGKSIFIDCIGTLLGDKLTTGMIAKGKQKTIIEGTFSINDDIAAKLEEAGYDSECLIVTRQISIDGKSSTRLNHRSATVSFVRNLLAPYVDIHEQRDNAYLLNEKYHLDLLDEYCQDQKLLEETASKYKEYASLVKKQKDLLNTSYNEAELEIIRYQLQEIEKLNITDPNEDEEIQKQLKQASQIEKTRETVARIKELFDDDGILDKLYEFSRLAKQIDSIEEIAPYIQNINDAYYNLQDDYANIMDKIDNFEIDEDSLNELNSRLYQLQNAKRKYSTGLAGLIEKKEQLQQQIDEYANKEFTLNQLDKAISKALEAYKQTASQLTELRTNKAADLCKEVKDQLNDLALENTEFSVEFKETEPSAKGSDDVRFLVSTNKGQPLQPLAKVASGGELSRLMLGLKVIFARLQGTKLIIFDEIDTGVSGKVALKIGQKMAALGKEMQVFSVTHLASVAACASQQYLITKQQNDQRTNSNVELLDENQRIETLAVLSSADVTETSLAAAKELFDKAQKLCR